MPSSGHVLDNRYRLDERIATGGMGDVWRGTDVVLGRVVAVKVLRPAMLADPEFAARFYGEARMMAAFRHPGVVEVYDYASASDSTDGDECAYLVMAYVDGEPLSTRLKEYGRLSVTETMSITAQTADALHAAHEHGTVHRDVKPGNLIVKPNGTVILVDFGVARSNAVTSMTGLNAIVGTALYMAPEQVAKGRVTAATDIYALGAVAYHCIAGRPPFDGDNALQVALRHLEDTPDPLPPDVPERVRALIAKAMAKHPEDRFASAAEFAREALAATRPPDYQSQAGTTITTPASPAMPTRPVPMPRELPYAVPERHRAASRGQRVLQVAVVALILLSAGVAVAIYLNTAGSRKPADTPVTNPPAVVSSAPDASSGPTTPASRVNTKPTGGATRTNTTKPSPTVKLTPTATLHPTATPTPGTTSPTGTTTTAPTNPPPSGAAAGANATGPAGAGAAHG